MVAIDTPQAAEISFIETIAVIPSLLIDFLIVFVLLSYIIFYNFAMLFIIFLCKNDIFSKFHRKNKYISTIFNKDFTIDNLNFRY